MSVIFSRAPLRISLGGGGTDLPSYYREHGGFLVSGAIDKYVYMLTHTVFQRRYRMKYSELEEVDEIGQIRHPILRETLLRHWRGNPLEIASVADVPAGTGMGSSGAYTVCLLKGLAHARRTSITPGDAGRGGVRDRDRRARRAGRQAGPLRRRARGDLRLHVPSRRRRRGRAARARARACCRRLRDQLLLFYTGEARSASTVLADQDERSKAGDEEMLENLHRTKELGLRSCELLKSGDLEALRGTDARALGAQAPALARHDRRAHRPALHARAAQRRDRRQARGRRRRRLPARLRPAARGHAGRRWPRRAPRSWRSTSSSTAPTRASTRERRCASAIVGCGLIGAKRAAALRRERRAASPATTSTREAAREPRRASTAPGPARRSRSCSSSAPDVVVVATVPRRARGDSPSGRCTPARTCSSRSRRACRPRRSIA